MAEVAFLAFLWVNLCTSYPIWALRPYIAVRGTWQKILNTSALLMRGNSLQIVALAREVASLKGRLSFLWNIERVPRERNPLSQGTASTARHTEIGVVQGSVHEQRLFVPVCVVLSGVLAGWLLSVCALCLGIWLGRTS